MIKVFHGASRPDGDPVDLIVQTVQEKTQELLGVLLTVKHTYRRSIDFAHRHHKDCARGHVGDGTTSNHENLLVSNESGGVSLDLSFKLRRTDSLAAGR